MTALPRFSASALVLAALSACTEAPPSRAVLTLYTNADGQTKCVEVNGTKLTANPSCCPTGFSVVGFASPAATAYHHPDEGTKKYQYRHVVCLQDLPDPQTP